MSVRPVPEGYHSLTPYLIVEDAEKFIDFASRAFDAKELHRSNAPDGSIMHAELQIGDSRIMLGQATDKWKPVHGAFYYYVQDTDAAYKRALEAGGESTMEPADQFYGDRNAGIKDPFGNHWWIATHKEDLSPEEMKRRTEEYFKHPR
jgi:PhnB protein